MGPPNKKKLLSLVRAVLTYEATGVTLTSVVPDELYTIFVEKVARYEESALLDVKAVNGSLEPWYPNYSSTNPKFQIAGFIDAAANTPAALNGYIPFLEFDTTEDTTVSVATIGFANLYGVALWQAKVVQHAGNVLQVPAPKLLNPYVFEKTNVNHRDKPQQPGVMPPGIRAYLDKPEWPVTTPDDPDDLPIVDPFNIIPQP
jgi:hypothetical protein